MTHDNQELAGLRQQIDTINEQLVALLNERAEVARQIGKAKQGGPIYDHAREVAVLRHIMAINKGPLSNEALTAIFKEVITACRTIQQP